MIFLKNMKNIYLDWHISDQKQDVLNITFRRFLCSEVEVLIDTNEVITGLDIVIHQGFNSANYNDKLMELLLLCDVLKRNEVKSITLIAPFLPYTRQDKTMDMKSSLGCKVVADLLNYAMIDRLVTFDLHAPQLEGFFCAKVEHKTMLPQLFEDISKNYHILDTVIVFPDAGAASRAKNYIQNYEFDIAIFNKTRKDNSVQMKIIGNVEGMNCVIVDDMIDSGGTILTAAQLLKDNGVKNIAIYATHGIFSGNAMEKFANSPIDQIVVTNTLAQQDLPKLKILNIPI